MNIANRLTVFRIILIPVFLIVLLGPWWHTPISILDTSVALNFAIAGIIFALASLTDFLDGYLARKHNLVTSFGAFFDPMADKLLVMAAFISLVELGHIPGWIVIVILSREFLVTGLRVLLAQQKGEVMSAAMPGKIKTFTQMLAILFYLFNNVGFTWMSISIADMMLYICLFFTVYSGIDYFYHARFVFKNA